MDKAFVSRKPIYESSMALHAYDLVSQPRTISNSPPTDEELATVRADLDAFSEVGLDQIVGDHRAFVNVSRDAVVSGYCKSLSKQRVVLVMPEDIGVEPTLNDELRELSRLGYTIAVRSRTAESVNGNGQIVADIVRVEVRELGDEELSSQVDRLSHLSVRLLADNVDTYEQFELCKKHKFDMYQGIFFCSPKKKRTEMPVNRLAALRVMGKLQDPNLNLNSLGQTISTDVTLSYNLLRFANSAFLGLNRRVQSISHAAKMVGMDRIRLWASLAMYSKMEDMPRELMITSIVRAAMCERLASSADEGPRESFFTVGLLSVVDALMNRPMEEAIEELFVSNEIKSALTRRKGSRGEALQCVVAYEQGEWDQVRYKGLKPMTIRSHYLDSLGWARRITEGLNL